MVMYLMLAWRNLWRNKGRTIITIASVFFAIILVLFTRAMQLGTYAHMIDSTVKLSTGYLQVQDTAFWNNRSIDNSIAISDSLLDRIRSIRHVTAVVPRVESFALAASSENTRGVSLTGIDPGLEAKMNELDTRVDRGEYLKADGRGALIGLRLAEYLSVGVGDSLVVVGQGFRGVSAAGIFEIAGIVDLPQPELESRLAYLPIGTAQSLYGMPGRVTSVAVMIDNPDNLGFVADQLRGIIPESCTIMDWREMLPELVQSIQLDNAGGVIMLGILYVVIGFGIFGTAMMMAAERRREFAIMVSVGMKMWRLAAMVLLETMAIGLLGTAAGAVAALPLLFFMRANPIELTGQAAQAIAQYGYEPLIPFQFDVALFARQMAIVLGLSLIASAYPIWSTTRLRISSVLRS